MIRIKPRPKSLADRIRYMNAVPLAQVHYLGIIADEVDELVDALEKEVESRYHYADDTPEHLADLLARAKGESK